MLVKSVTEGCISCTTEYGCELAVAAEAELKCRGTSRQAHLLVLRSDQHTSNCSQLQERPLDALKRAHNHKTCVSRTTVLQPRLCSDTAALFHRYRDKHLPWLCSGTDQGG
jgi:hypothetical protein